MADMDNDDDQSQPGEIEQNEPNQQQDGEGEDMQDNIMVRLRSLSPQDMAELDRLIDTNPTLSSLIIKMFPEIQQDVMAMVAGGPPGQGNPMAQQAPGASMPQRPMPGGGGGLMGARRFG